MSAASRPSSVAARAAAALPFAVVVAIGLVAWWGVWRFGFKFDDMPAIAENVALARGDWWGAAFAPPHQPLANRPLSTWSLALGAAILGPGPMPALLGNLLLHLLNGCLLFAIVRRVSTHGNLAGRATPAVAARMAMAVACLWVAHPLATDTVAYATQRSTALGSACFLAGLWAYARGAASARPWRWQAATALALALAAASKEDFVGAPFLVALFDRAFCASDWRTVRSRLGAHVVIAVACWATLAFCVASGPANDTVGFATARATTAWQWLLTQAGVVMHYVRLAAWPTGLRGAYDWDVVTTVAPAILPGLCVLAALAATAWLFLRRPHWGFLGALFFVLLAPTSSVMPIVTEVVAERRAYLPMLAVVVPLACAGRVLLLRLGATAACCGAVVAVGALASLAQAHAATYRDEAAFWQRAYDLRDPAARNPFTTRIVGAYASGRFAAGDAATAHRLFDEVVTLPSPTVAERLQWAASLQQRGRHDEALAAVDRILDDAPRHPRAHGLRGVFLARAAERRRAEPGDAQWDAAAVSLARAVEFAPTAATWRVELASVCQAQARLVDAERALAAATALADCPAAVFVRHDGLLRRLDRSGDAEALWRDAFARRGDDAEIWLAGAQAALASKDASKARERLLAAKRLAPGRADIDAALAKLGASPR